MWIITAFLLIIATGMVIISIFLVPALLDEFSLFVERDITCNKVKTAIIFGLSAGFFSGLGWCVIGYIFLGQFILPASGAPENVIEFVMSEYPVYISAMLGCITGVLVGLFCD